MEGWSARDDVATEEQSCQCQCIISIHPSVAHAAVDGKLGCCR